LPDDREPRNDAEKALIEGWITGLGFAVLECDLRSALLAMSRLYKTNGAKRFEFLIEVAITNASIPDLRQMVLAQTHVRHHAFEYTPPNMHTQKVFFKFELHRRVYAHHHTRSLIR
jgi:hypothetical protein